MSENAIAPQTLIAAAIAHFATATCLLTGYSATALFFFALPFTLALMGDPAQQQELAPPTPGFAH